MEDIPISKDQTQYISKLKDFYEYKTQYESLYKDKKKNILKKKSKSITEKLYSIQQIKMSCIQCGKEGGTLFKQENKILSATCLATEPCDLNINIKLSNTLNLRENIDKYNKIVEKLKSDIIITKLSLIFDLEKEDIVSQKFNAIKDEYKDNQKNLDVFQNILNNNINFVVIKDKNSDEEKRILRDDFIKKNETILNNHIKNFNEKIELYKSKNNKKSLEEAIDIHLKNILPIVEYIRQKKYNITYIDIKNNIGLNDESSDEKIYINQHKNYISNYFYSHEKGEILKHVVSIVDKNPVKKNKSKKVVINESPRESGKEIEKTSADVEEKDINIDELFDQDEGGETQEPNKNGEKPILTKKSDEADELFDQEEGVGETQEPNKNGEKPILTKKSEAKKLSDLDELEEFEPEIDS